nr:pentapeptide repeat-containing protein [Armatimonas rosea]
MPPLGHLCSSVDSINPASKGEGTFRYIDISSLDSVSKRITAAQEVQNLEAPSRARQVVRAGDVLVSTVRPRLNAVTLVPEDLDGEICSTGFCVLRPDTSLIDPTFLFSFVRTAQFIENLAKLERGQTYPAVSDADVRSVKIPLPPLAEQRRIVEILSLAEEIRDDRRLMLEGGWVEREGKKERVWGARDLMPALFHEMFGDPTENPKGWQKVRVGDAGLVQLGRQRTPQYQTGQHFKPYLRVANVFEDRIDISDVLQMDFDDRDFKIYRLEYGDILLNEGQSSELVGRPAMWRGEIPDCCFQNTLIRFRGKSDEVTPVFALSLFLYYYRRGEFARIGSKTSSIAHLGASRFAALPFLIPPRKLQDSFVDSARWTREIFDFIQNGLSEADKLIQSVAINAFLGNLTEAWRKSTPEKQEAVSVTQQKIDSQNESDFEGESRWLLADVESDFSSQASWTKEPDDEPMEIEEFFHVYAMNRWREHLPLKARRPEALAEIKGSLEELVLAGITENASRYWTAELLAQREPLQRSQIPMIQRALETLSEAGLIVAVGKELPSQTVFDKQSYMIVYRAIRNDEHLQYNDILPKGDLRNRNLAGLKLRMVDLRRADLSGAILNRADLESADLRGANLKQSDLRWANLRNADLSYATLTGADLENADLRGANLDNADLLGANLLRAIGYIKTEIGDL